jgi:hypothetical protein
MSALHLKADICWTGANLNKYSAPSAGDGGFQGAVAEDLIVKEIRR